MRDPDWDVEFDRPQSEIERLAAARVSPLPGGDKVVQLATPGPRLFVDGVELEGVKDLQLPQLIMKPAAVGPTWLDLDSAWLEPIEFKVTGGTGAFALGEPLDLVVDDCEVCGPRGNRKARRAAEAEARRAQRKGFR